jgi:hypothetical protein
MKLDKVALGLAAGLLWGLCVFAATAWVTASGRGGEHLELLARFYLGYSVSWVGAVVGLVWGFVDGFICGWLFGWIYNRFSKA